MTSSCSDELTSIGSSDKSSSLEEKLKNSPELQELLGIRDQLIHKAIKNGVTSRQLQYIRESNDEEYTCEAFSIEPRELKRIKERIVYLSTSLIEKYPSLQERISNAGICAECNVDNFIEKWDKITIEYKKQELRISARDDRRPLKCNWVLLGVAAYVCAASSGGNVVTFTACAYLAVCTLCEGGFTDDICFW